MQTRYNGIKRQLDILKIRSGVNDPKEIVISIHDPTEDDTTFRVDGVEMDIDRFNALFPKRNVQAEISIKIAEWDG